MSTQENSIKQAQKPRKKYEKPAVIYLAELEAMAGVCTPFPEPAQGICPQVGKDIPFTCNQIAS